MKKFLALLLSVAMLVIPMTAFAADVTPAIEYIENKITVAEAFDSSLAGRLATLVVVNPGKDIADIGTDLEVIAWADEVTLDQDGAFKFVIDMTYAQSGDGYKVYVTASGTDEVFEGEFDYDKDQVDVAYVDAINDCELKSAMESLITTTLAARITEIDDDLVEDFTDLKNESKVAEKMVDNQPYTDMDDFVDELRDQVDKQKKAESKSSGPSGDTTTLVVQPEIINPQKPVIENPFYDIEDGYWGKDAIISLYEKDIVAGQGDGYFRPNNTITRAEFVQMVVKAFGLGQNGEAVQFTDVKSADWFAKAVQIAYSNGVVSGTSETTFSPNMNITRQDMMVILANAANATGKTLRPGSAAFADAADISGYAMDAVSKMTGSGIVYGTDGYVKPLDNASRAEAAAMLARLLDM